MPNGLVPNQVDNGGALTKAQVAYEEAASRYAARRQEMSGPAAYFMREEDSPFLHGWRPALRDSQDVVRASYTLAAARATDAIHNSGWLSGGIDASIASIMGSGLRLNARPDTTVIKFDGLTDDDGKPIDATGWARYVERRWETYSNDPRQCDAVGRQTISQMLKSALIQWFRTGEIVGVLPYRKQPGIASPARTLLMQSHRLSQRTDPVGNMVQGVRMDGFGCPMSYLFEYRAPALLSISYQEVQAFDSAGRRQVAHIFHGGPGQVRGISPLTPCLVVTRQYDQLSNATLTAALVQTIFAATIESEFPTSDFMRSLQNADENDQGLGGPNVGALMEAMTAWNTQTNFDLKQAGKINHLFPGEKMKFNRSEHPNGNYEQFAKFLLREMARCLGITYEEFTGDYTGATYSSVRMSTAQAYTVTLERRNNLAAPFMQAVYDVWLEAEIDEGRIKFPGGIAAFLMHRAAAARAGWRGPPKPQADDIKTANTHRLYKQMGILSDETIAADLGYDIEDVYEALAREAKLREKFGVKIELAPATMGIPGAPPLAGGAPGGGKGDGTSPADGGSRPPSGKPPASGTALDGLAELPDLAGAEDDDDGNPDEP